MGVDICSPVSCCCSLFHPHTNFYRKINQLQEIWNESSFSALLQFRLVFNLLLVDSLCESDWLNGVKTEFTIDVKHSLRPFQYRCRFSGTYLNANQKVFAINFTTVHSAAKLICIAPSCGLTLESARLKKFVLRDRSISSALLIAHISFALPASQPHERHLHQYLSILSISPSIHPSTCIITSTSTGEPCSWERSLGCLSKIAIFQILFILFCLWLDGRFATSTWLFALCLHSIDLWCLCALLNDHLGIWRSILQKRISEQ